MTATLVSVVGWLWLSGGILILGALEDDLRGRRLLAAGVFASWPALAAFAIVKTLAQMARRLIQSKEEGK